MSSRQTARLLARSLGAWRPAHQQSHIHALSQAVASTSYGFSTVIDAMDLPQASAADRDEVQRRARAFQRSFTSTIHSLEAPRPEYRYPEYLEGNIMGRGLLTLMGAYGRKQQLHNGAAVLYGAIVEQAEDPGLAKALGLDPAEFMTTWSLLALHMWLVINRLKVEPRTDAEHFQQHLYTSLFYRDVEARIYKAGVQVHVSKWQRKLEQVFFGSSLAYDRALTGQMNEEDFYTALIKNVYGGDAAMRPFAELLARYLRRELQNLGLTPTEALYRGQVKFDQDIQRS